MLRFKTDKLKDEFNGRNNLEGTAVDERVVFITLALAGYVDYYFNKYVVVTDVLRTQQEQDLLYSNIPEHIRPVSTHQFGRAIDVRITSFTNYELEEIKKYLNTHLVYSNTKFDTCIVHNVGRGKHIHIQVDADNKTEII